MSALARNQKILVVLFLLVVFVWSWNQLKESDSFYHLKTGELIWQTQAIPHADVFSFTAFGARWVPHEWLAELVMYGVWAVGGFWALIAAVAALAVAAYWLIVKTALLRGASLGIAITVALAAGALTFELWIPRPQIFSYVSLALLVYALSRLEGGARSRYAALAVAAILLWANTNASVVLGLVVVAWWAIAMSINHHVSRGVVAGVLWGSLAAVCVNPVGPSVLWYAADIKAGAAAFTVLEWKSIVLFLSRWESRIFLAEIVIGIAAMMWWGVRRIRAERTNWKQDLFSVGLVMGISILPMIAIRHVGFWPIVAAPVLSAIASEYVRTRPITVKWSGVGNIGIGVLMVLVAIRIATLPRQYYNPHLVPVAALDFIERQGVVGPWFNTYNEGGYLIWRLFPRERVFMDGRSEVFVGRPTKEFFTIVGGFPNAKYLIDEKYGIRGMILGYRPDSLLQSLAPLIKYLLAERWALVWWDDAVLVFVRPDTENQSLVEQYALRHVAPFRTPSSIPPEERKAAGTELEMLLGRVNPESSAVIQNYAEQFLLVR